MPFLRQADRRRRRVLQLLRHPCRCGKRGAPAALRHAALSVCGVARIYAARICAAAARADGGALSRRPRARSLCGACRTRAPGSAFTRRAAGAFGTPQSRSAKGDALLLAELFARNGGVLAHLRVPRRRSGICKPFRRAGECRGGHLLLLRRGLCRYRHNACGNERIFRHLRLLAVFPGDPAHRHLRDRPSGRGGALGRGHRHRYPAPCGQAQRRKKRIRICVPALFFLCSRLLCPEQCAP